MDIFFLWIPWVRDRAARLEAATFAAQHPNFRVDMENIHLGKQTNPELGDDWWSVFVPYVNQNGQRCVECIMLG